MGSLSLSSFYVVGSAAGHVIAVLSPILLSLFKGKQVMV